MSNELEEFLRGLETEEEEIQDNPQRQSKVFTELRDKLKDAVKDIKRLGKETEELRNFKTEALEKERKTTATEAFKVLGLTDKQADLFLRLNPEAEVTAEAVKTFTEEYGFTQTETTTETETKEEEDQKPGWSPTVTGQAGGPVLSDAQYEELLRTSPAQARQAVADGRYKLNLTL